MAEQKVEEISLIEKTTLIYNAMLDSIDQQIKVYEKGIELANEVYEKKENATKKETEIKDKKVSEYEKLIQIQKELRSKLTIAFGYFNHEKNNVLAQIEESFSRFRDSFKSGNTIISETDYSNLVTELLEAHATYTRENKFNTEIEELKQEITEFIKKHGLYKQVVVKREEELKEDILMDKCIRFLFTDIKLAVHDLRKDESVIADVSYPKYNETILSHLEIIRYYREMVENGRIEKVEESLDKKGILKLKYTKDETGEEKLVEAREYSKLQNAAAIIVKIITENELLEEFKETVEILQDIERHCAIRVNNLIASFEHSSFEDIKKIVDVELAIDKYEAEKNELNDLYKEAYKKIGKEHERLMEIAENYARIHEIKIEDKLAIEDLAKQQAHDEMIMGKTEESKKELDKLLADREAGRKYDKYQQYENKEKETVREPKKNYEQSMFDLGLDVETDDRKQDEFYSFMSKRKLNKTIEKVDSTIATKQETTLQSISKTPKTNEELLIDETKEIIKRDGKIHENIDEEAELLAELYKKTIGMTSDERAYYVLSSQGKIDEESLEEALKKSYLKIVLESQKRIQRSVESVLEKFQTKKEEYEELVQEDIIKKVEAEPSFKIR